MKEFPDEYRHGSGATLLLDRSRLLVGVRDEIVRDELGAIFAQQGIAIDDGDGRGDGVPGDRRGPGPERVASIGGDEVNHTPTMVWVRDGEFGAIDPERADRLAESLGDRFAFFGPVYRDPKLEGPGARVCPLPTAVAVALRHAPRGEGAPPASVSAVVKSLPATEDKDRSALLPGLHYLVLDNPAEVGAFELRERLLGDERVDAVHFENMPMVRPLALVPNDPLFAQQWDMTRIEAGGPGATAWDISTGTATTVVAILDQGCDLAHPDLRFAATGTNLGGAFPDGRPTGNHGTPCAGIAAARFDNAAGVAGVAGGCSILPIAFQNWTDLEVAAGITYAATHGAHVVSMSFGQYGPGEGQGPIGWNFAVIDPAIADAVNNHQLVLCAATGNENIATFNRYPARHPLVMACGASDQVDERKSPASPDGEAWGANWAPGVSVVAPGVRIPATDRTGADGYNPGDYTVTFNGTSAATRHVAGLAALVRSVYPALSSAEVRAMIERTADKVGATPYADAAGFPNGSRNQPMGHGRINARRALDLADVSIRDWPGDTGTEPSIPAGGNFWDFSDIVVRPFDDHVFDPSDLGRSRYAERGQTNHLYVRVQNRGPRDARNVTVQARITPYVGLQFIYPGDWTATDATHVSPAAVTASFASIAAGTSVIAHFEISPSQVDTLWGWSNSHPWHPCLLAEVRADNDYAFISADLTGPSITTRRNNLAQRNLTVIDILADAPASVAWPFVAGHRLDRSELLTVRLDRSRLPVEAQVLLALDDDGRAFPLVDFSGPDVGDDGGDDPEVLRFLERTKVRTRFGNCEGVLVLEKGSVFRCHHDDHLGAPEIRGGELVIREGARFVRVTEPEATITVRRMPGSIHPLSIVTEVPGGAAGSIHELRVAQLDEAGDAVGGATVALRVVERS